MIRTSTKARYMLATSALGALSVSVWGSMADADVFTVTDHASFADAMQQMVLKRNQSHTIKIANSFTMGTNVAPVVLDDGQTLTITGNGNTIDGANAFRPFFITSSSTTDGNGPITTISNLTIKNGGALGGTGSGGGLGAGGGLFVDQNTTVIIDMVDFMDNSATGGAGGTAADGGGLGGNGSVAAQGGGGGDLFGNSSTLGGGGGALATPEDSLAAAAVAAGFSAMVLTE